MKRFSHSLIPVIGFCAIIMVSCATRSTQLVPGIVTDGKYDSEFPTQSASTILERIAQSVKKLNAIAYYEGYVFAENEKVTLEDIFSGNYVGKADSSISFHNSTSGTSTILYSEGRRIAILTCAHVVAHPDTLITYHASGATGVRQYLESFSIKRIQRNILIGIPDGSGFKMIAQEKNLDVAILGKEFFNPPEQRIPAFDLATGSASELQWGSFVYLMGWPKGHPMVTRGIISNPDRDKRHSFLVDGLFNRGFSGGIVLAIRDGIPNLELVGMIGSASASSEQVLIPQTETNEPLNGPQLPYKDEVYIKNRVQIDYGITYGVSIESIIEFVNSNKDVFAENGYDSDRFFHNIR